MKSLTLLFAIGAGAAGLTFNTGCDRTVSHSEEVKQNPNGTVTKKVDDVTKDANGNTVVTHEQKTN